MDKHWEKRVAKVFCIQEDVEEENNSISIPEVESKTLKQYLRFLKQHLTFPFQATFDVETGPLGITNYQVKVVGLEDLTDDFYGLLCVAREGRKKVSRSVIITEISRFSSNFSKLFQPSNVVNLLS